MSKKLMTACMALVAFAAFVLPASASATSPALTTSTGALYTGKVLATNLGNTTFTGSGGINVVCSKAVLTGEITTNDGTGTPIEGNISSASFTGTSGNGTECSSSLGAVNVTTAVTNGVPWCVRALAGAAMELQVRGGKCSEKARAITFVLDVTTIFGTVECKYERTAATGPVKGTYNTSPADARGTVTGGAGSEFTGEATNSGTCPATGTLDMEFTLEEDPGGELFIS